MDIKNELLDIIQEYSYKLYKAGMRQAAGDYAYFVAWVRSENWDNPLKNGKNRLPPEPLGINTVDPYSNNCPIPYEKIVPIDEYTKIIINNIITSLESLQSLIVDENVINVIENFIEASGKTEYSYNAVPLIFVRPDVDYTIPAGGSLVLHYNYKNTNYNVAGHLLGKYGKLNTAVLRAEDAAGNEVSISDLSLAINGAEVSLVNNSSDSITLNKVYVAYGEWSYGVTGYNYTFSDSLENLSSSSLSALRLAPPSNLTYFDTDFLSFYKTIVGVNEVDCEEYQDYVWGKRAGLTVALYGTRINVKNTSSHNIENIHGIRFKNWFPETATIKSNVKFTPEKDDFDFKNVAYLDLSKDLTDITVDGIFVYDSNGNKIKYDISKVYHITSVFGGTFEYDDPGVSLFNKDGFIGIKKDSIFATDLAIHIKYSIADKPPAYCTNCGSKLDLYDVCHNTECILSPDYIEPPMPDLEYSVMSTWMNSSHTNGQINSGATTTISLGKYDEKYTTKQSFKIDKVYSGDEGADLLESHSLALGQYGSSDMARIQNTGSDRILLSKLEYLKYNNACFVTNGQTFWSTTPVTLAPKDAATVKLYTSSLGSRGWGTYLYESDDYTDYELVDVVLIDSNGEHRLYFKDKLKLNVEYRYSTIENISDMPFTFSYAIIKLVPRVIEYCDNCGEALDKEGVCHNTECSSSPDYIERCPECNSALVEHVCHNTECILSPDYIVPSSLELDLYLRAVTGSPVETHFGENDHWYSIIRTNSDLTKLSRFGHATSITNPSLDIGFGCIKWNPDEFNYEFVDIYDGDGNKVIDYGNTSENVYLDYNETYNVLSIYTRDLPINSFCYTWRIRITKKPVVTLFTNSSGNSNELVSDVKRSLYNGSGECASWSEPKYEILNAAVHNGSSLVWQGKSWANTYLKLVKDEENINVIANSEYSVSIAAIKVIGVDLASCPTCGETLDYEDICHNTKCPDSPDYIEDEDPVIGGELSLTGDTSLTTVIRAPLGIDELELVGSFSVFSLDEDEVI